MNNKPELDRSEIIGLLFWTAVFVLLMLALVVFGGCSTHGNEWPTVLRSSSTPTWSNAGMFTDNAGRMFYTETNSLGMRFTPAIPSGTHTAKPARQPLALRDFPPMPPMP